MQTFIPYGPAFSVNAACLDMRRNGKQRVEGLQILNALRGLSKGWVNHPATKMWRGHEEALVLYTMAQCEEWINRGYKDTILDKLEDMYPHVAEVRTNYLSPLHTTWVDRILRDLGKDWPRFLLRDDVRDSHRSNLLRKDPGFYARWNWEVPDDLPYVWPA